MKTKSLLAVFMFLTSNVVVHVTACRDAERLGVGSSAPASKTVLSNITPLASCNFPNSDQDIRSTGNTATTTTRSKQAANIAIEAAGLAYSLSS